MIYGYARVSTRGQAQNGNSLEAQEELLRKNGAQELYSDSFTGTTMDRPAFNELLGKVETGDEIIVTKLDRLGRSISQASGVIASLIQKGVTINVLNLGILSNDSVSTLMQNVLLSFAQYERDCIVQRTAEGKAVAKAMNPCYREGRKKKYSQKQLDLAMERLKSHSYSEVAAETGISKSTLIREHRRRKESSLTKLS